jgi:hypothetical protein
MQTPIFHSLLLSRSALRPMPNNSKSASQSDEGHKDSLVWRAAALSVVLSRLPSGYIPVLHLQDEGKVSAHPHDSLPAIAPLTLLCLRVLLSTSSGNEFAQDIAPYLPRHLRRDLMRYTSIFRPLSNSRLSALCEPEGHADGELIIVGPQAIIRGGFSSGSTSNRSGKSTSDVHQRPKGDQSEADCLSWDSIDDGTAQPPLHTLVLLSTSISVLDLLAFPPTLTHLGLISLHSPVRVHRLPAVCPLLVVLDLSFNKWMGARSSTVGQNFEMDGAVVEVDEFLGTVNWTRWNRLEVLGLRGCSINGETRFRMNIGRWSDVDVIY